MTTANQNNAGVEKYQQEQANVRAAKKWSDVLSSQAAQGREKLARSLLGLTDPHEMTVQEILATLSKAPAPANTSGAPAPAIEQQQFEPNIEQLGSPRLREIFDENLRAKGEAAARWLLNK